MTDGCGFMNKAGADEVLYQSHNSLTVYPVALHVQRLLDLKYLPTAVQARIAGVKGMVCNMTCIGEGIGLRVTDSSYYIRMAIRQIGRYYGVDRRRSRFAAVAGVFFLEILHN